MSLPPPKTPMRAGAQDAAKKPSVIGGKVVAPTGKQIGCVGGLKDRTPHHNHN